MVIVKKFSLLLLDIWVFLNIVIFLTSKLYFFHGSFEMFPTEEQEEKAKIFATIMGTLSFSVGALLATCRVKLGRNCRKWNRGETG